MKIIIPFFIVLFSSCSLFQTSELSQDLSSDIQRVCLDNSGRGRLIINNHKYVFSFESMLSEDEHKWIMGLNFPIYGEELLEVHWDENRKVDYKASFENRVLKDKKGVDPELLNLFLENWSKFVFEIINLKQGKNKNAQYKWTTSKDSLEVQTIIKNIGLAKITFQNLVEDNYFGRFDVVLQNKNEDNTYKVEMIVRKCLKKTD